MKKKSTSSCATTRTLRSTCWTDGAGVCEEGDRAVGTGTESRQFLLTVTADGSQDFNPREVNVSVDRRI